VASRCTGGASHVQPTQALPLVEQRIVVLPRSAAGASFARPAVVERRGGLARPLAWGSDVALNAASGAPGDKSLKGGGDGGGRERRVFGSRSI